MLHGEYDNAQLNTGLNLVRSWLLHMVLFKQIGLNP